MKYAIIIAVLILMSCKNKIALKTGHEGKPLPQFSLLMADSASYFNTKNLPDGKPVVMFLFSPQCPYCRAQMKAITEDIKDLEGIQFVVLTSASFRGMKHFYDEFNLGQYKNIIAGVDTSDFLGNYFQAARVPYLAIYDKDKKLNQSIVGKTYVSQIKEIAMK